MKTSLTIAGSDCSGGAGIQADIKTMTVHGVYAMSVISAITAQNTTGVYDIHNIPINIFKSQLNCIFTDIYPDSVKIGMLPTSKHVSEVAAMIKYYGAKNIVSDPVMVSTSGQPLCRDILPSLNKFLFPVCSVITPNINEAELITGIKIRSDKDTERAAKYIYEKYGCSVLCKGGHRDKDCNDFLYTEKKEIWLISRKIKNTNTHGTGCTLSSSIASGLALGYDLITSVKNAKQYITEAINDKLDLGKGNGPLNHIYERN